MNYNETLETLDKLCSKQYKYKNIDTVYDDLEAVKLTLKTCRNELCNQCGKYKNAHLGACRDCRWEQ